MDDEDEKAASLVGMGFDEASARRALRDAGGRGVEGALDILLSGGGDESGAGASDGGRGAPGADNPGAGGGGGGGAGSTDTGGGGGGGSGSRRVIRCGMSQYDVPASVGRGGGGAPVGKSACTAISLYGAYSFLSGVSSSRGGAGAGAGDVVTPEFLRSYIIGGIDVYSSLGSLVAGGDREAEHLSAEEVLACNSLLSDGMRLIGGVRQGMLTAVDVRELDNPLGMRAQLDACRSDPRADQTRWMAVVVTKTPETVCVLLPPPAPGPDPDSDAPPARGGTPDDASPRSFVLLDSHPRPHLSAGGDGSYAILHSTMRGLVDSLSDIFPVTQLSPDVGDLVAMMYNSFDVYALQRM